ncbi:hypothetical protein [Hydrogenimonas sp.]
MDNKQFIVEILQYTGWPIVVLSIAFMLKDKIINIFGAGIKSAKHGDSEIHFFEAAQEIKLETSINKDLQRLIPQDITGLREELEINIKNEIQEVSSENEKVDILIKNLAQAQISNNLDKVYYYIYGSQIKLLEFLSIQENGESNIQNILFFFKQAKQNNPETFANTQFSDYINFLISWDLVQNIDSKWIITTRGKGFVKYITAMQYNKDKIL